MTDSSTTPVSPPRRFGLRTLFVVVVIVSIPCAWVGYSMNWIRQRREAFVQRDVERASFCYTGLTEETN